MIYDAMNLWMTGIGHELLEKHVLKMIKESPLSYLFYDN
jgi:hypothetical protein